MMQRILLFIFLITLLVQKSNSQQISSLNHLNLKSAEDSLKELAPAILQATDYNERKKADSLFTKTLVRALKTNHSFYYPFDSVVTISHLYAPDSSFRIFSWQVYIDDDNFRHKGAIQMKTKDGKLELFPLIDQSDFIENPQDSILNQKCWFGALYYKIILKKFNQNNYYTLLGFDENNSRSNKKIIEVLHFENGQPIFGCDCFITGSNESLNLPNRYVMEYKSGAGPRLNYDEELDVIVKENLISENKNPEDKTSMIGSGDYDGFKWKNGKWIFFRDIFGDAPKMENPGLIPVPQPLKDSPKIPD